MKKLNLDYFKQVPIITKQEQISKNPEWIGLSAQEAKSISDSNKAKQSDSNADNLRFENTLFVEIMDEIRANAELGFCSYDCGYNFRLIGHERLITIFTDLGYTVTDDPRSSLIEW